MLQYNPSDQTELPAKKKYHGATVYTLRKGGCDAKDIQSWLGHSDVSTTLNVYGHILAGDLSGLGTVIDGALFGDRLAV